MWVSSSLSYSLSLLFVYSIFSNILTVDLRVFACLDFVIYQWRSYSSFIPIAIKIWALTARMVSKFSQNPPLTINGLVKEEKEEKKIWMILYNYLVWETRKAENFRIMSYFWVCYLIKSKSLSLDSGTNQFANLQGVSKVTQNPKLKKK